MLWELSIVSNLSLYGILAQHACNDYAWLTSECSPRYDMVILVRPETGDCVIHRGYYTVARRYEFYGHWKTLTLSSISPNASKHWRFLAFWLSLCFGNCLLFLICHCTAFLLSTRAMTTLGWHPNALRDMVILVRPETGDCVIHKGSTQFSCVLRLCKNATH